VLPALLLLALVFAGMHLWIRWMPSSLPHTAVFRQTDSGWQRLPPLAGNLEILRISPRGTVWASTWSPDGLSRLEGGTWRRYGSADFGTTSDSIGRFTLDGEDVWAAALEGVLHWDGRRWQCYRNAGASSHASSIVAAGGQVWTISYQGVLSHFAGGQWTTRQVDLPGLKKTGDSYIMPLALARTSDGALWLLWKGLWRFNGASWIPTAPRGLDLTYPRLAGVDGNSIWVSDWKSLWSISSDGSTATAHSRAQMGLTEDESIDSSVSSQGRTWFTTGDGIVEFDGAAWRRIAPPREGVTEIESVQLAPDGKLWVIGSIPNPAYERWRHLYWAVPLALLLGMLAGLAWLYRRSSRHRLLEHQRVRQAVEHATGEAPEALLRTEKKLTRASSWWGGLAFVGTIVGALIGYTLLRRIWPTAPSWTFLVIALALHVGGTLLHSLVKRTPKPWDPIGPGGPPRYEWAKSWKTLAGAVAVFLLMNVPEVPQFVAGHFVWIWAAFGLALFHRLLSIKLLNTAVGRGDYEGALRIIRWFYFYHPGGGFPLRLRGFVLLVAGRYREAEDTLRRAVSLLRSGQDHAFALQHLGHALSELGREDEAMRSFEAALHALPGSRLPYCGMAEQLLRQAKDPARALTYIERIVDTSGVPLSLRPLNRRILDDYWGLKAWALAELGRSGEVAAAIENALKATPRKSVIALAATWYRAGMALQTIGDQAAANDYFRRARNADPHGRWGGLAAAALRAPAAWQK